MAWRLADSLITLRKQVNEMYPNRSKVSDGSIGDELHQKQGSASDHNPNAAGVVTALDLTHDPAHGFDIDAFTEQLLASKDPRIKYVIANGLILIPFKQPWASDYGWHWQNYSGEDPHISHAHISVNANNYDDATNWKIGDPMEKVSLEAARLFFYHVLGYDGIRNPQNALRGDLDKELNDRHVGKPFTIEYLRSLHNSQPAKDAGKTLAGIWSEAQAWREYNTNKPATPGGVEFELVTKPLYERKEK